MASYYPPKVIFDQTGISNEILECLGDWQPQPPCGMNDLEKSFGSINLEKSLGDDIEDFHEEISMRSEPSSEFSGIYSFQTKLLTATDLQKLKAKHQEFFKTFSK